MYKCTNELGKTKVFYVVKDFFFVIFFLVPVVCCPPCRYVKYINIYCVLSTVWHIGTLGLGHVVVLGPSWPLHLWREAGQASTQLVALMS